LKWGRGEKEGEAPEKKKEKGAFVFPTSHKLPNYGKEGKAPEENEN